MGVSEDLGRGLVIPAHPLALDAERRLDERRQAALTRYYCAAGAGGVAVGVHTTQFAIRDPAVGLLRPVLALAMDVLRAHAAGGGTPLVAVAGVCGPTPQAVAEAELARGLGYHVGLLSLAALREASNAALLAHCRRVADVIPLFGFYLQPAVGGRVLGYDFWRRFAEIGNVWAVKIAPFDRYRTLETVRGILDSGRDDIALYTGNDDNIVNDLLTPFVSRTTGVRWMNGGLLGQWAVGTRGAVQLLGRVQDARAKGAVDEGLLRDGACLTEFNAAVFDARNTFRGCIPGIHEVLRRTGLLEGTWCLDPGEQLSEGQALEIDRVARNYPFLSDDEFIAEHRDEWMR